MDARRFQGAYTGTSGTLAAHVMRLLGEINTRGTTIVVATHDTSLARDLGRRTIVLKGGRVVEDRV